MMDRDLIIAQATAKLSLETAASPAYAANFVTFLVQAIEQTYVTPLTAKDLEPLKVVRVAGRQKDVLLHLHEDDQSEQYSPLVNIAINLQLNKNEVRLAARALARKGLAERVPFYDDDGFIRGSGYGITAAGRKFVAQIGGAA